MSDAVRDAGFWALAVFGALVAAFLLLPLVILCVQSFTAESYLSFPPPSYGLRWYQEVMTAEEWREAAGTSLAIAAIVTPLSLILGTLAALGLERGPMRGRNLIYGALISPMILPHIVLGLGIFRIALQMNIDDSLLSIVPAHLTITIPCRSSGPGWWAGASSPSSSRSTSSSSPISWPCRPRPCRSRSSPRCATRSARRSPRSLP